MFCFINSYDGFDNAILRLTSLAILSEETVTLFQKTNQISITAHLLTACNNLMTFLPCS